MQLAYFMPLIQLEPTNLIMMQFMQSLLKAGARENDGAPAVAEDADPSEEISGAWLLSRHRGRFRASLSSSPTT